MGTLNRVVNIVILVLAVVAVVFGTLLFKKREELRFRGDKMAAMINSVAGILDANSETAYQKALVQTRLELDAKKDPAGAAKNAKLSLYHNNYANLESVLAPFKKQAQDIAMQRDVLGATLKDIADTLEIPETFAQSQFQSVGTYDETKGKLVNFVKKVNDRDNALVDQIAASAKVIGFSVQPEALKNLDEFAGPLGEFGTKVDALKKRSDAYGRHITSICQILDISTPSLEGEDYASSLSNTETAVRGVKDEFERTKQELASTKQQLEETRDKLRQTEEKYAQLETKYQKVKKELDAILNPTGEEGGDGGTVQFVKKLKGTVIDVNRKWDFVVIDLGSENKMTVPAGKGKTRDIVVSLPMNVLMTASRDDNYLGKLKIIRVNSNCAIADILPEQRKNEIQVGDQVFFGDDAFAEVTN
jgi:predicted  nucleic acid-binding Zn-ribbon protein